MVIETPRDVLAAILRRAAPRIVAQIADEAARSVHTPGAAAAYAAWMGSFAPITLDAVAADETERARLLAELGELDDLDADHVPAVPPVARVGLLEIALRLAREEIERDTASRADAPEVLTEFRRFADQLRVALAAAGAVPNAGR